MSSIDKVVLGTTTYVLRDNSSGYGTFTATQGMQSTVTGATLVGTLKYRTFVPISGAFGATNTVNLYSTPGGIAGNNYTASVDGNVLSLTSSSVMLMPDLSSTSVSSVPAALEAVGLLSSSTSKTKTTYTVLCNGLIINNRNTVNNVSNPSEIVATYSKGDTFTNFDDVINWSNEGQINWTVTRKLQFPAAGTAVNSDTNINLTYVQSYTSGGSGEMS